MLQLPDLRISDNTQLVLGAAACVGVIGEIVRAYLRKSDSGLPLPPSPPTWRLRGHFLPSLNASLTIARWIDEYGPLITIRSGIQNVVIIGRYKAAVDIMEKQGGLLADRPRLAAGEILTRGLALGLSHAGDRFRRKRRALHTHLQPKAAEAYQPLQMSHAKSVVLNILDDPHNFQNHAATYASATIMKVAYGKTTPTSATDPEIKEIRELFKRFRFILRPGSYLVDSIPLLKYLPGYAPELRDERERTRRLYTDHLDRVKQQMQSDVDIGPSFAKYMLENEGVYGLTEIEMAYLAGAFFGAGTETTAVAICTVLLAAAHFPEEQAKVQDELDAVIGRERAPTFADKPSLPRLEAFISEALRWRPLAPEGLPHRTTREVIWENYCIPVGTIVTGNHWAISRDPEVYPEPDAFKPQRWINDQGRLRDDLSFFVYGFGRRVCPGQHLANRSVFINSLLILWAFQLTLDPTKPQDDMGFMNAAIPNVPCAIEFKTRVPEVELRGMMQNYSEAGPLCIFADFLPPATIMKVAYGKTTPTSATDPEIIEIRQLFKRLRFILRPSSYLVDSIPLLKYLPGYAPELKDERHRTTRLYTDQLNHVKQQMQSNVDIGPSFAKYMLENEGVYGLTEIEMAYLAGAFFGAGTSTTAVAICTVLLAAAHFPEEQAQVQDELDAVIGRERAPTPTNNPFLVSRPSYPRL